MKTNLVLELGFIALRFEKNSLFSTFFILLHIGIIKTIMNTLAKNSQI